MGVKNTAEYVLFRIILAILRWAPFRWSSGVLRCAARTAGRVPGLRGRIVKRQLQKVFPERTDSDIAALAAAVYDHLGRFIAETLLDDPGGLLARVAVSPSWREIDRARERGRGVILATAHLGNFELGGRVLAGRYPLLDVVKPQRNAQFDRYLQAQRARFGIRTVVVDRSGRAVLRHLSRNGVVSLFLDQDAGKTGTRLPFLGHPASTWTGAARISIRTGCPVVPVAILRTADDSHVLSIAPALEPEGLRENERDIAAYTARISAEVERFILDRPEQWFWVHRRWKGADEARRIHEPVS